MTGESRVCTSTGLQLIAEAGESTFRVAKPQYGSLSSPERRREFDRSRWGRYDSPGNTLYVAEDEATAFAEVIAPFKRQFGMVDPLEKDAAALGMKREEFLEAVAEEWSIEQFMGIGAVPRQWRTDRQLYRVYCETRGWFIDVEHPNTISWLEGQTEVASRLSDYKIPALTTAVLRGENRQVTTLVGTLLRQTILDTGLPALGIQFGSKFGSGWCRAIWMPRPNTEDWGPDLIELSGEQILATDEHLARACEWFRIRVF